MACQCIGVIFVLFIFVSSIHDTTSLECELGHESSVLDKFNVLNIKSCPTVIDRADEIYCCVDEHRVYCCDSARFVTNGFGVLLPVLIAVAVGFLIVCCLCCLCCPCCLLYKRRHRGTVYGNVIQPGVQTVVVTPQPAQQQQAPVYVPQPMAMPMPGYSQTAAYSLYPTQAGQLPPTYNEATGNEVYNKQAPYNPNFQ